LVGIQLLFAVVGEGDGFLIREDGNGENSGSQNSVLLFVVQIHVVWEFGFGVRGVGGNFTLFTFFLMNSGRSSGRSSVSVSSHSS
jgi:hypothetical protein